MNHCDPNELEVSIWVKPHHSYGYVKSIFFLDEDGVVEAFIQEQSDGVRGFGLTHEIDSQKPVDEKTIKGFDCKTLVELIERIDYKPFQSSKIEGFGGSFFGVRIGYGFDVVTYQWNGRADSCNESVANIFTYISEL